MKEDTQVVRLRVSPGDTAEALSRIQDLAIVRRSLGASFKSLCSRGPRGPNRTVRTDPQGSIQIRLKAQKLGYLALALVQGQEPDPSRRLGHVERGRQVPQVGSPYITGAEN